VGELQRVWKDEYIFGMWKGLLPWMLAWVSGEPPKGPQSQRLSLAPTWSWASINSRVYFHHSHTNPIFTHNTLIDITWETAVESNMPGSPSPFPRLSVKGTLIRSTEAPAGEPLSLDLDLDDPSDQEESVYLVLNHETKRREDAPHLKSTYTTFLVLRRVDEGVYARVGLADHHHKQLKLREGACPWLALSKRPRVKIYLI